MRKFDVQIFMAAVRQEAGETPVRGTSLAMARKLLRLEGEEFLRQAYRAILGREIDRPGLDAWRSQADSMAGKIRILGSLWLSPERVYLRPWQRTGLKACAAFLRKR